MVEGGVAGITAGAVVALRQAVGGAGPDRGPSIVAGALWRPFRRVPEWRVWGFWAGSMFVLVGVVSGVVASSSAAWGQVRSVVGDPVRTVVRLLGEG
jgi:hypothetical protein